MRPLYLAIGLGLAMIGTTLAIATTDETDIGCGGTAPLSDSCSNGDWATVSGDALFHLRATINVGTAFTGQVVATVSTDTGYFTRECSFFLGSGTCLEDIRGTVSAGQWLTISGDASQSSPLVPIGTWSVEGINS